MKRIIYLLLTLFYTLNSVFAYSPSCSTVGSLPYGASWVSPNKVVGTQVLGNDNTLLTPIDTICGTDLPALPGKASTETITGAWTFQNTCTISSSGGLTFGSGGYYLDSTFVLDGDNAGAGATQSVRFNRGSTDANDARFEWDETNDIFTLTSDGTTLADTKSGSCDATGEVCTYADVVRSSENQTGLSGNKTWTGDHSFSTAITQGAAASNSTHLMRKLEHDTDVATLNTSIAAVTAGGCAFGTSIPSSSGCAAGACYNRYTSSGIVSYVCTSGGGYVQEEADTISKSVTYSSSGYITINSGSLTLNGGSFAISSSGTFNGGTAYLNNIGTSSGSTTAASNQYVADYVAAHTSRKFSQTATTTTSSESETTLTNTGSGSLTLGANSLAVGNVIRITAAGNYTDGTGLLTLKVKTGIITFATITFPDVPVTGASEGKWRLDALITVRSGNFASGQAVATISDTHTTPTNQYYIASDGVISNVFDITSSQAVDVTAQWGATAGTLTCTDLVIEVL